jgi:hypothetical protein
MTAPGTPALPDPATPADVTLAYLCALARARPGFAESGAHRPCRFCATAASVLAAWADRYGRPADPLPVRLGRRKAAR